MGDHMVKKFELPQEKKVTMNRLVQTSLDMCLILKKAKQCDVCYFVTAIQLIFKFGNR